MCNLYGDRSDPRLVEDAFSELKIRIVWPRDAVPNWEPRDRIRPTNAARIARRVDPRAPDAGVEMVEARWWLVPFFHKGPVKAWKPMCTNARSETVATTATFREPFRKRRCLVPATHYFEWTGEPGRKTLWRFTKTGADLFCFAGLWDRAETVEGPVESFTILTCAAGPDCAPYHTRQPVILERGAWSTWLDLGADVAPLLRAGAPGSIQVAREA
jgi:putative SOS response-associated peptidase YedK